MNAPVPDLSGRRVAVFGLGRSGVAAARLALAQGADVLGTDARSAEQVSKEVLALERLGLKLELAGHPAAAFEGLDLAIVSPGVAPLPLWDELAQRGVEVMSELE